MQYLIECPCGHSLDRHGARGCGGDANPCTCMHTERAALEAAVDYARTKPWGTGTPGKPA